LRFRPLVADENFAQDDKSNARKKGHEFIAAL
jgi:hypothetical protein